MDQAIRGTQLRISYGDTDLVLVHDEYGNIIQPRKYLEDNIIVYIKSKEVQEYEKIMSKEEIEILRKEIIGERVICYLVPELNAILFYGVHESKCKQRYQTNENVRKLFYKWALVLSEVRRLECIFIMTDEEEKSILKEAVHAPKRFYP